MSQDPNEFLMAGGVPSAKFPEIGTVVTGEIVGTPRVEQQRDINTSALKFWDDGRPMMQMVIALATEERDPSRPDDDGTRALYVRGRMQAAIRDAVRKVGAAGVAPGGWLTVTYGGDGPPGKAGFNGPKLFSALYRRPTETVEVPPGAPDVTSPPPGGGESAAPGLTPAQLAALRAAGLV